MCRFIFFELQLGEYSDPFDLKKDTASTEKETAESTPDVILPLSEDDYSIPYEVKDRQQGNNNDNIIIIIIIIFYSKQYRSLGVKMKLKTN